MQTCVEQFVTHLKQINHSLLKKLENSEKVSIELDDKQKRIIFGKDQIWYINAIDS